MINFARKIFQSLSLNHNYLLLRLRSFLQQRFPVWFLKRQLQRNSRLNPYCDEANFGFYKGRTRHTLGIIREFTHFHRHYIAACRQLDVSYRVLDLSGPDWLDVVKNSNCDAFLVWPSAMLSVWKQMYDERLWVMVKDLGKVIFPTCEELWMWESKRRMCDWLVAHNIPSPRTWIFYDYDEAIAFVKTAALPVVFKTDHSDSSRGVKIIRNRAQAVRIVKRVFSRGYRLEGNHRCDLQWGSVIFQTYIPDATEWRLIRVGDSYFGYIKKKHGDYASGFGDAVYADPPGHLLSLMRDITENNGFRSMSIDVLTNAEGEIYVTELQSLFGDTVKHRKMMVDGKAGRYLFDESKNSWNFQEGIYDQNVCCNLRVEYLIKQLERRGVKSD